MPASSEAIAATVGSPRTAISAAAPAVSAATIGASPSARISLRHCESAWTWLLTVRIWASARARQGQEMMVHPLEMLADDVQPRIRHQVMDVGDTAGDRIFDRDHRQPRPALAHRGKGVLELVAGQGRHLGKDLPAGEVGISPGGALKRDRPRRIGGFGLEAAMILLLSLHQSAGAREIGRGVDLHAETRSCDQADRDAHAGFERAQLLEPLALFEHAARQRDKALERGAAIGVEPDMLVMRAVAPRHRGLAEIERARRPAPGRRNRRRPC